MPNPFQSYIPPHHEHSCHPPPQYLSHILISCCFHQLIAFKPKSYISLTDLSSSRMAITSTYHPFSMETIYYCSLLSIPQIQKNIPFFSMKRNNCASASLSTLHPNLKNYYSYHFQCAQKFFCFSKPPPI